MLGVKYSTTRVLAFLFLVAEHAADADALPRASFDIAVAARAQKHLRFLRLYNPLAVLLLLLRRALVLAAQNDGLFFIIVSCHMRVRW